MSQRSFKTSLIVSCAANHGIGRDNDLLFHLPKDLIMFKKITTHLSNPEKINAVLMGRKTWESLPKKSQPLPNRLNIILSSSPISSLPTNAHSFSSIPEALNFLQSHSQPIETLYIIGGESIYDAFLSQNLINDIYLTRVNYSPPQSNPATVFFPHKHLSNFHLVFHSEAYYDQPYPYQYEYYSLSPLSSPSALPTPLLSLLTSPSPPPRSLLPSPSPHLLSLTSPSPSTPLSLPSHQEYQYLSLLSQIVNHGHDKQDRTGTGTYSLFGTSMRFSLSPSFPLLTTKSVFFRGVVEELLWFIQGHTNERFLSRRNVHIWRENATRSFLDGRGLFDRPEGDLGPVYGFQWRFFGAAYRGCRAETSARESADCQPSLCSGGENDVSYEGEGVDQLAQVIEQLRKDPDSRRIVMSAWNPLDLPKMALPPCHIFCQFYLDSAEGEGEGEERRGEREGEERKRRKLSCAMYQRSGDFGLGIPFNIASYSLLTIMIAHLLDYEPGEFIHFIGDSHVYKNHVEPLVAQISRVPRPFPQLKIRGPKKERLEDFTFEDFELIGYCPHPKIEMKMAV